MLILLHLPVYLFIYVTDLFCIYMPSYNMNQCYISLINIEMEMKVFRHTWKTGLCTLNNLWVQNRVSCKLRLLARSLALCCLGGKFLSSCVFPLAGLLQSEQAVWFNLDYMQFKLRKSDTVKCCHNSIGMCAHMHACTHTCMQTCMHARTHARMHMLVGWLVGKLASWRAICNKRNSEI